MRRTILISIVCLGFLLSGCQVFPYALSSSDDVETLTTSPTVEESPVEATPSSETIDPTPSPEADITTQEETEPENDLSSASPQASEYLFTIQEGSPFYLANFAHPAKGCSWTGVAGQVFDEQSQIIKDLTVLIGKIAATEKDHEWYSMTGTATAYGDGGYEIQIMDSPHSTTQVYWIQIVGESGESLSDRIYFDTFEDCQKNLILINFVPLGQSEESQQAPKQGPTTAPHAYP